jgi:signal transduction histidine kinase
VGERKKLSELLGEEAFHIIDQMVHHQQAPMLRQEMLVKHPENRQLYLGYSMYCISDKGRVKNYALTFMEISQTKRLQAEIIRMDRMASLGVLASGIAHEIRNPLAGIKAMAQTLQEELDKDDSKNEYIERIVRQVNRLDELLKSFFSYARPQRPNPVRCKIPDIVREVLPLFRRKIKVSNIIVKEVYSRDLKEIFVDFHQIEQVFFNLIINAIDAMKDGGTLTIRARLPEETTPIIDRRQRIPKLFSDVYNEITISDTGTGMDHETLNNMYNPFFTTKTNGTGLGLSIVYQIILEHGGQITVDSEMDRGTTFRIFLPVYVKEKHKK